MGLALKDSPPGFDPSQVVNTWGTDETVTTGGVAFTDPTSGDDSGDAGFAETEQL
jgi:hypothetical protein